MWWHDEWTFYPHTFAIKGKAPTRICTIQQTNMAKEHIATEAAGSHLSCISGDFSSCFYAWIGYVGLELLESHGGA